MYAFERFAGGNGLAIGLIRQSRSFGKYWLLLHSRKAPQAFNLVGLNNSVKDRDLIDLSLQPFTNEEIAKRFARLGLFRFVDRRNIDI